MHILVALLSRLSTAPSPIPESVLRPQHVKAIDINGAVPGAEKRDAYLPYRHRTKTSGASATVRREAHTWWNAKAHRWRAVARSFCE
jgi:hypothetical protein